MTINANLSIWGEADMPNVILRATICAAVSSLLLTGCTVTRTVHLYPANPTPAETAVIQGVIVGHGQGHGTAKFTMPDGEILLGEYSIVFGGSVGFGTILGSVSGPGGTASRRLMVCLKASKSRDEVKGLHLSSVTAAHQCNASS